MYKLNTIFYILLAWLFVAILKTFEVNLEKSRELAPKIPDDFVKVSESGIGKIESIQDLKTFGFKGFLIGERFMNSADPGDSALNFIKKLES